MKHVLLALVIVLSFGREAQAQQGAAVEIEAVISQQMDAFQGDDFGRAFDFAADNIRRMFGTPENFGEMVKRGYPMVHRSEDVRFGNLRQDGDALWQRVLVRDGAGVLFVLDYLMVPTVAGWRIAAVQMISSEESA